MANLNTRVDRLEESWPVVVDDGRPDDAEIERRWHAAAVQLVVTMAPEHIEIVSDDPDSPLTREVMLMLSAASGMDWPFEPRYPLALPPAVAQVWRDDPDAGPHDACLECHYPLPARSSTLPGGRGNRPAISYFEACPLCGSDRLRRVADNPHRHWSNSDGCYYVAGRRVTEH